MAETDKVLNREQEAAVRHGEGPLLIVAGAGTGKTTVVTERIKHLLGAGLAKPEEILALTFTEKAAREMEERVDIALPYGTFGLWISTFHSFCDRILRAEALHIGLSPAFKLLTEAESYLLVKKNFWKFDLKYFRPHGNPYKFIEGMTQHFARLKDEDISPPDYSSWAQHHRGAGQDGGNDGDDREKIWELAGAYRTYEELKIAEGAMDFGDLIGNALKLFRSRPAILARYQRQFKYVLVDEFQDTNYAQYELIKLLAPSKGKPNLTVVGDDSQSIYKFRGAAISNILSFMKDYPKAEQVVLAKNYRSTQTILDAAYKLIKHNDPDTLEAKLGIDKNIVSQTDKNGAEIELIRAERVEEEAESVINTIKQLHNKDNKYKWGDVAILVRANNHSAPFVRALERARIPYQFLGPGMLFRQPEVKDLIAYLRVLYDFTDSVSLYRVLSMDIWGISQRDLIAILNWSKRQNLSLFEALEQIDRVAPCQNIEPLRKFGEMVHRHQELIPKETAGQILYYFLQDSGLLKNIVEHKTAVEERKALNITKFFDKLKTFEATNEDAGVFAVVDYLDLAMEMGESPLAAETDWTENDAVNILTVHSAKGLEFKIVFLVNLVEGRFPTRERREQIPIPDELIKETLPAGDYHLEEERRLFYVGMTRAKERLIFSAADYYGEGKKERKLSPFIYEALGARDQVLVTGKNEKQLPLFEWTKPSDLEPRTQSLKPAHADYLSYSAIQSFRECPLHYKLRYILRLPSPARAPLSLGNSVHLALRDFYRLGKDEQTEKTLLELLDKNWILEGYASRKHEAEAKEKAGLFLGDYLRSELHAQAKPLYLEQPFVFRVGQTLKIGGKIDRVDDVGNGVLEIIDYKTGANVPTQKEIDIDLQMTIYALAATDKGVLDTPIDKVRLTFYFFDTQSRITTVRTQEALEEARRELLAIRDEIEKSDFACTGGRTCENCEFKMLCNG